MTATGTGETRAGSSCMTKAGKTETAAGETRGTGTLAAMNSAAVSAYLDKTITSNRKGNGIVARNWLSYSGLPAGTCHPQPLNRPRPRYYYYTTSSLRNRARYNTSAT